MTELTKAELIARNDALQAEIDKLKELQAVVSGNGCAKHGRADCKQEVCKK